MYIFTIGCIFTSESVAKVFLKCKQWLSMCHVIICSAHQQLWLAEMDIEHPGSYDISSFGDRTKKIC